MSYATSTDKVRVKPDPRSVRAPADAESDADGGLQPWQFFVLAALGCATAVTFVARGQGPTVIILLSVLMGTAGFIGYAGLRMVRPLVAPEEDRTVMIGERTRAALEREKLLTLRSIKELEFDRAMGRLSESDFHEMAGRLRARAAGLIKQLDAGAGYRDQIEKDLAKRLGGDSDARLKPSRDEDGSEGVRSSKASAERSATDGSAKPLAERLATDSSAKASAERVCSACATADGLDARSC